MKKMFLLICAAAVLCVLILSGCKSAQSESAVSKNSVSVSSSANSAVSNETGVTEKQKGNVNITVTMPEGWRKVEGSAVPIQYQNVTRSFIVKEEKFEASTLDEVVGEAKKIYEASFAKFAVTQDSEVCTVSGLEARKLCFTCEISDMELKYMYVYVFAGGRLYTLTFGDLANSFDQYIADYDTILSGVVMDSE